MLMYISIWVSRALNFVSSDVFLLLDQNFHAILYFLIEEYREREEDIQEN